MAYVVARKGRRYEARESVSTAAGPRARTLATFTELDDDVLAQVRERATTPVDDTALLRSARKAGATVTVGQSDADRAARTLLAELNAGRTPSPILAAALEDVLGTVRETRRRRALPDPVRAAMAWAGSSLAERGEALRDLLLLADRIPARATR
jgi:hypothetical protein